MLLRQCLDCIDEASIVAVDIFSDAQDRYTTVYHAKIRQNGTRQDKRLLADFERQAGLIKIVARLLSVWSKLYP